MSDKKPNKVRRGIAKLVSKLLGDAVVTNEGLQKALNQRESEVRNLVSRQEEPDFDNAILSQVENFYDLRSAFEERKIPARFVQFAESLGITSENGEAIDLFESLIWKDRTAFRT